MHGHNRNWQPQGRPFTRRYNSIGSSALLWNPPRRERSFRKGDDGWNAGPWGRGCAYLRWAELLKEKYALYQDSDTITADYEEVDSTDTPICHLKLSEDLLKKMQRMLRGDEELEELARKVKEQQSLASSTEHWQSQEEGEKKASQVTLHPQLQVKEAQGSMLICQYSLVSSSTGSHFLVSSIQPSIARRTNAYSSWLSWMRRPSTSSSFTAKGRMATAKPSKPSSTGPLSLDYYI